MTSVSLAGVGRSSGVWPSIRAWLGVSVLDQGVASDQGVAKGCEGGTSGLSGVLARAFSGETFLSGVLASIGAWPPIRAWPRGGRRRRAIFGAPFGRPAFSGGLKRPGFSGVLGAFSGGLREKDGFILIDPVGERML